MVKVYSFIGESVAFTLESSLYPPYSPKTALSCVGNPNLILTERRYSKRTYGPDLGHLVSSFFKSLWFSPLFRRLKIGSHEMHAAESHGRQAHPRQAWPWR